MNADLRQAEAIGLCVGLGTFFGILSLVAQTLFYPVRFAPLAALALASVVGGSVGLVCSGAFVPLIWRKPLWKAGKWLLIGVSPVVLLSAYCRSWLFPWSYSGFVISVVVPAGAFIGMSRILNRALKDIYPRYPTHHCQKCGYNLTGNVSGICPECGTRIEQP